jgi:dihydrofolate reductase
MILSLIAVLGENRVIGNHGKLPWHISSDLKRFKKLTTGHTIIMGRTTWESIGSPLPNRRNIVLSGKKDFQAAGCEIASSLEDAIFLTNGSDETFIIGGGQIYASSIARADRMYLTLVHDAPEGDTFFPIFKNHDWKIISSEEVEKSEAEPYHYTFTIYERIK